MNPTRQCSNLTYNLTEGQERRALMANYEMECSEILPNLYASGCKVASSWEFLETFHITRIVNCSASIVMNSFEHLPNMKYLALNLIDGRDEDISWFVYQVIKFIDEGISNKESMLVHCEKGISRSCTFVIAYCMWSLKLSWKDAFNFVQSKRKCCNPNSAFSCNLMEIFTLMQLDLIPNHNLIFRLATHMGHDLKTNVLKLCRNDFSPSGNRDLLSPKTSYINPFGVYVIRPSTCNTLFVLYSQETHSELIELAIKLAYNFIEILTTKEANLETVMYASPLWMNMPAQVANIIEVDGPYSNSLYEDLLTAPFKMTIDNDSNISPDSNNLNIEPGILSPSSSIKSDVIFELGSTSPMILNSSAIKKRFGLNLSFKFPLRNSLSTTTSPNSDELVSLGELPKSLQQSKIQQQVAFSPNSDKSDIRTRSRSNSKLAPLFIHRSHSNSFDDTLNSLVSAKPIKNISSNDSIDFGSSHGQAYSWDSRTLSKDNTLSSNMLLDSKKWDFDVDYDDVDDAESESSSVRNSLVDDTYTMRVSNASNKSITIKLPPLRMKDVNNISDISNNNLSNFPSPTSKKLNSLSHSLDDSNFAMDSPVDRSPLNS